MKEVQTLDLGFCKMVYYDNNILHIHHYGKMPLTLAQAKILLKTRNELTENNPCFLLSTASNSFNMPTKKAAQFIQSVDAALNTIASACVITTFPQRLGYKAVFFFQKLKYPFKVFDTKEDAIKWLLSQKEENV